MKLRKKTELVNWYLDFAQRKNLEKITDEKELQELNKEVERLYLYPTFGNGKVFWWPGSEYPSPHKLSEILWNFFDSEILPSKRRKYNDRIAYRLPGFEITLSLFAMAGEQIHYQEIWDMRKDLTEYVFIKVMELLDGCPADSFYRCKDPACQKWFFNPTKKEKHYCSKACLWRHKSKINRQKDDYKIRQRIRMKFTYVAGSGKSEEGIRKTMIKYMKDLDLSQNEIDQWLDWWKQKRAGQKKED